MLLDTSYKVINHEDFIKEFEEIKDVLSYKGRRIAEVAGVSYPTLQNTFRGSVKNPSKIGRILQACKIVYNETIEAERIEV